MQKLARIDALDGIDDSRVFLGVAPRAAHAEMLKAYESGARANGSSAADAIRADIDQAIAMGCAVTAAELLNVLRMHVARVQGAGASDGSGSSKSGSGGNVDSLALISDRVAGR